MTSQTSDKDLADPKRSFWKSIIDISGPYEVEGVPVKLYLLMAFLSIGILKLGLLSDAGVAGAFGVLWTIGFFFYAIGERVKIFKVVLGGGLLIAYMGAATVAYFGFVSPEDIKHLQAPIIDNKFLYYILAALIVSSITSLPSAVLRRSLISIGPIILGGLFFAFLASMLAGFLVDMPMQRAVSFFLLPVMGGGTGAGAIPMSEVYADVTGGNAKAYFNFAIGVLTLGNIAAVITASLLNQLGKRFPGLSGGGILVKGAETIDLFEGQNEEVKTNTHAGSVFVACVLMTGFILAAIIGFVHLFAWVTIIAVLLSLSNLLSPSMQLALKQMTAWLMKAFIVTILVAFGLSADFNVIGEILSPGNVFVIVSIVVGAAFGAGLLAYFVKCYPIEGALAGGLCMANAGGSGDLQVLGAAQRLELYPYAQISSRLGGAFVLILATYLFQILS